MSLGRAQIGCLIAVGVLVLGVGACTASSYNFGLFNNRLDYEPSMAEHRKAWEREVNKTVFTRAEIEQLVSEHDHYGEPRCEWNHRPSIPLDPERPCYGPRRLGEPIVQCGITLAGRLPLEFKGFSWYLNFKPLPDGRFRLTEMGRWNPARSDIEAAQCARERNEMDAEDRTAG